MQYRKKRNKNKNIRNFFSLKGFLLLRSCGILIVLLQLCKRRSIKASGYRLECPMQRLRTSLASPNIKRKALNSWAAVQDTYLSTKDTFERHRVVFTVGTSIASVATAWIGYTLRHYHESRIDQRLESIEKAMKNNHNLEHLEIKQIVGSGSCSIPACVATAGTTLIIGYVLGWRGRRWYANKNFRREQMKMLGLIKPKRWQLLGRINPRAWQQLQFLRRPLTRSRMQESSAKASETTTKDSVKASGTAIKDVPVEPIAGESN